MIFGANYNWKMYIYLVILVCTFQVYNPEIMIVLLTTTTKTMEVKYFKVKHKVLKNSLHVQIWSDFEKLSLKMSGKA
jgi:hypothetical protein